MNSRPTRTVTSARIGVTGARPGLGVWLTSMHSLGSGTQLLERGWTLHYSGVAQGLLLLFVPTGRTAVQSTRPSWSPWEGYLIVLQLGTPLFYWGTSTLNNSDTWRA
ncbi:hypothetical protein L3Q82_022012 [Scortum barcoo]|uniref:Uncharacterized protein n=1 Tax=Scortum barcoo TaxID=214431 RepID=A0ACB8X0K6_9TELE|nr:hypothetical protein L3Q82_022012 [Scortum barcoo]